MRQPRLHRRRLPCRACPCPDRARACRGCQQHRRGSIRQRRHAPHEHGRHGGSRRDRSKLEVHRSPTAPAEVAQLTTVSATTDEGHKMQTPNCDTAPTSDQVLGATEYVQATSAAVAKYKDLSAARAAGYFPITNPNYPVVHYLNPSYMNMKDLMNPNTVDSLVYATTPYGPVLVAAMYLMPGPGNGPMPYGCLVQWHHTPISARQRRPIRSTGSHRAHRARSTTAPRR